MDVILASQNSRAKCITIIEQMDWPTNSCLAKCLAPKTDTYKRSKVAAKSQHSTYTAANTPLPRKSNANFLSYLECFTTLPLTVFAKRNFVAIFLRKYPLSHEKWSTCVLVNFGDGIYGQRTLFILGSLENRNGLPISDNGTFFTRCYG